MEKFFDLQRFVEEYYNDQPNKTLTGTSAADYFENSGSIVKIYGLGGDDTVGNTGGVVTIAAGDGNNSIRSFGSDVSITAGNGNDDVVNYTSGSSTENVKILVGDGNNSVFSSSESSYVTIVSGKGEDSVKSYSNNAKISVGAGDDVINNGVYNDVWGEGGINVLMFGGAGNDSVYNNGHRTYSNGDYATLSGGTGNDYLYSSNGDTIKVDGGSDNDTIDSYGGDYSTLSGGDGDDSIKNDSDSHSSLSGGNGNDILINTGGNVTITGGKDNDLISLQSSNNNAVIQYAYGDGNDTIFGFNSTDTLQIATNKKFTTISGGSDLFIMFDNDEVITLKDVDLGIGDGKVGSKNFVTVKGGDSDDGGDDSTDTLPSGLSLNSKGNTMTASKDFKGKTIDLTQYEKVKTLNASAVTQNLNITGNSLANKISGGKGKDTIYGGAGKDSLVGNAGNDSLFGDTGNDTLNGGAGNDTLTGGKGNDIFVHSAGKDVITDYQAGKDKIYLDNSYIKSWKVSGKNVVFTTEKGTLTVNNGKGKKIVITTSKTYSSDSALFAEENNFVTADNLSAIVENNSVGEFEFNSSEKLTQENLITFADK